MKKILPFLLCLLFIFPAMAQDDTVAIKKNVRLCADSMILAFMQEDWKTYTRFTMPSLVEMLGGEEGFIEFTKELLSEMPDSSVKEYTTGEVVQLVKTAGSWQSVIEQTLVFEADSMRLVSLSYLFGVSYDGGRAWTFIDPQGDINNVKLLFPDVSPEIRIPETKDDLRNMDQQREQARKQE